MLALFLVLVARLPPPGSVGVWVYDHPTAWPAAQWASTVDAFNVNASSGRRISNAVIYGSDMEIYDGSWCCSPSSQEVMGTRIARYGQDPKTDVTLIVDGRMDGGEDWSPNLARLSPVQLESWSLWVAQWVCAYDRVDGVQLDLEPIGGPWNANLKILIRSLSGHLRSKDFGCTNSRRPNGVSLSTFALVKDVDAELVAALGPQGFVVVSGYDLGSGGAGTAHSPAAYRTRLDATVERALAVSAQTGMRFMVGIPAAASTHEFEQYGPLRSGFAQVDYVAHAFAALKPLEGWAPYLGHMIWALTFTNVYPPHSDNVMRPTTASADPEVWAMLQSALPPPVTPSPSPVPATTRSPPPSPPPSPVASSAYERDGCVTSTDCNQIMGVPSYCRADGKDECGRSVCQGDSHSSLQPCPQL